ALGHLVSGGLASPALYFRFPLCEDLVRRSLLTGVHGELLAGWLQALVPGAQVCSLVHWQSVPQATEAEVNRWRIKLGADEDTVLIGCFGYIGAARRLDRLIDALATMPSSCRFLLVVVGWVDPALQLPERAESRGIADRIRWPGRVSDSDFGALLRAVDLAVNLRFPPARSSSAVLHQLLQLGVPTVITDLVHWRNYPDDAVARVPPGPDEAETAALQLVLERWLSQPPARERARRAARQWAVTHLGPQQMVNSYLRAVTRAIGCGEADGGHVSSGRAFRPPAAEMEPPDLG
ncbi:MAG: glycosyltransferase, partial [Acidobacteriota bacterium]